MKASRLLPVVVCCLLSAASICAGDARAEGFGAAAWIWSEDATATDGAVPGSRYFRCEFQIEDRPLKRAFTWITADNEFSAFLNGHELCAGDDWRVPVRAGLRRHLRPGTNVLAVRATNAGPGRTPAGLLASICIEYGDGTSRWIRTDATWRISETADEGWRFPEFDTTGWASAVEICQHGDAPWGLLGREGGTEEVPDSFPTFESRGNPEVLAGLREMMHEHYRALRPGGTMWDAWLVPPSLWPATERRSTFLEKRWKRALSHRGVDSDGYVHTHQHFSYAHNTGWPFPVWTQAGLDPEGRTLTVGWHFHGSRADAMYQLLIKQLEGSELVGAGAIQGWSLHDLVAEKIDDTGWHLRVTGDDPYMTSPATRSFATSNAPYVQIRLRPGRDVEGAQIGLSWRRTADAQFDSARHISESVRDADADPWVHHMFRLDRHPMWEGRIQQLRFHLPAEEGQVYCIDSVFTVYDTRHPINNASFIIGVYDYFRWTGDVEFLRENIDRVRHAMRYHAHEFGVDEHGMILVPWVGHGGRSGIMRTADGKRIHFGRGIGNNYFDLLPFGGFDFYASIQFCAAAEALAALEDAIARHEDWRIAPPTEAWSADRLRQRVRMVTKSCREKFWNEGDGRFVGAVDIDGIAHDYGFTFVNLEAVCRGLADGAQARSILDWISGKRTVDGDTSTGDDIYRWRFSPRMTTRRNVDWYSFVWNAPEEIPWGDQVQDGGAVLGWSYFDLHARLRVLGVEDAWRRFEEILKWYRDVQEAGGYRAYYAEPGRGTLQGGGTPGGLGIDEEFLESSLLPQFVLDGFMGFDPTPVGFKWRPKLPRALPSLRVEHVQYRGCVLALEARRGCQRIEVASGEAERLGVELPSGEWTVSVRSATGETRALGTHDAMVWLALRTGETVTFERASAE